ncbi:UDP-4-amino-4,6-dideoxy-N-acetyl-beta-L-altrosamine N-acetyltransferase [Vreelandella sp. H-I2]
MENELGVLRDIREDELQTILNWRNAPAVRRNMYTRHEISLEEHLAWWKNVGSREDQQYFIYEYKNTPFGVVAFTQISNKDKNASWAFYASPEAPRGTGSRMEYLALEYAFKALKLHKLHCEVLDFNQPVVNLHKKFGFSIEGVLRDQHLHEENYCDVIRLGILHSEWQKEREAIFLKLTSHN